MFIEFIVVLFLAALINIFSSHLLAILNNISVWWHVFGAAAVVADPDLRARATTRACHSVHATRSTTPASSAGKTSGVGLHLLRAAAGSAILTQYTITGYDASAHLSEETKSAANSRGQGNLALDLLFGDRRLDPAAVLPVRGPERGQASPAAGGAVAEIFSQALGTNWRGTVLVISTAGQFFCTVACMTSTTRMLFAFSRDGAVPGGKYWSNAQRQPGAGLRASSRQP